MYCVPIAFSFCQNYDKPSVFDQKVSKRFYDNFISYRKPLLLCFLHNKICRIFISNKHTSLYLKNKDFTSSEKFLGALLKMIIVKSKCRYTYLISLTN